MHSPEASLFIFYLHYWMGSIINFEAFLLSGILLNLTPGNDTIFILARSIGSGKKAGIVSALGIGTGSLIHTALAVFGLSLIIAKSLVLFAIIKYAGAVYLIYLGYKMLTDRKLLELQNGIDHRADHQKIYRDAIVTNLLNPKVALFFIAFLPQFIEPSSKNTVIPFLILGTTFIVTGTTWCLILAVFASGIAAKFKTNKKMVSYVNKACGITLIALGIKVALTGRK
jgi:RhtB (resistance to homoserine/threonine) family protein